MTLHYANRLHDIHVTLREMRDLLRERPPELPGEDPPAGEVASVDLGGDNVNKTIARLRSKVEREREKVAKMRREFTEALERELYLRKSAEAKAKALAEEAATANDDFRDAEDDVDRLTRERDEARDEYAELIAGEPGQPDEETRFGLPPIKDPAHGANPEIARLRSEVERLTRERDKYFARAERLRSEAKSHLDDRLRVQEQRDEAVAAYDAQHARAERAESERDRYRAALEACPRVPTLGEMLDDPALHVLLEDWFDDVRTPALAGEPGEAPKCPKCGTPYRAGMMCCARCGPGEPDEESGEVE